MAKNNFSAQGGSQSKTDQPRAGATISSGKFISYLLLAICLTLGLSISFQSLLAAWTAPLANPPTCVSGNPGCDAPLHTGLFPQSKSGPLTINYLNGAATGLVAYGKVGIGIATPAYTLDLNNGTFGFGNSNVRTESRDNAGLQGNAGAQSGFFETAVASSLNNYPVGASSWWHLIDVRHSNPGNNYALQIAGSFFDQDLYFRKTNSSPVTPWNKFIYANSSGNVGIGTAAPAARLDLGQLPASTEGLIIKIGATTPWSPFVIYKADGSIAFKIDEYGNMTGGSAGGWSRNSASGYLYATALTDNVGIGTVSPGTKLELNGVLKAGGNYYNVLSHNLNGTPANGIKIKTNIPYSSGTQMPTIIIEGYDYGSGSTMGISMVWYIYNGNFINYSASSWGITTPVIKLANEGGLVTIHLAWTPYYGRFGVRAYAQGMSEQASWFNGWTVADEAAGAANQVTVAYANTFGDIGIGGDISMLASKSIKLNSGSNTTLLIGNYNSGVFAYGTGQTASLAVEGDVKGDRLCIEEDCKASWAEIVSAGGLPTGINGQTLRYNNGWIANSALFNNGTNVGVGSPNPGQRLTVVDAGNVNQYNGTFSVFANNLTQGVGLGYMGIQAVGSNASQDLSLNAKGTGNITMQVSGTTGNVGIGTTDPAGYKLKVVGNEKIHGKLVVDNTGAYNVDATYDITTPGIYAAKGEFSNLCLGSGGGTDCKTSWAQIVSAGGLPTGINGQTLRYNNGWIANSTLFNNGTNVGVGTTNPTEKLTVAGGHTDTKLRLYSIGDGGSSPANLSFWASEPGWTYYGTGIGYNVNGSPYYGRIDSTRGSSYVRFLPGQTKFEFQNTSNTYVSDVLVINDTGNVGIGTAVPGAKLDVAGSIKFLSTDGATKMALGLTGKNTTKRIDYTADTNYWTGSMGWGGAYDWNSVFWQGNGFFDNWGTDMAGAPESGYLHGQGIQVEHYNNGSTGYGWQMMSGNAVNGNWYLRGIWGGGFGSWRKIITDDGAGNVGIAGDISLVNNKSIKLNSGSNTTLLIGNYSSGGFAYGTGQTASLAVEGDVKGDRLCIEEDCKDSWAGIGGASGWTDDGAAVRLTTITDKVGIGTASNNPWAKLDVRGGQIVAEQSGGVGWGAADGTRGLRVGWTSGYGASLEAWDGSSPKWGISRWNATTPAVVMQGSYANNDVNFTGTVTAGAFSGPLSGTLSAGNVSAGSFGSNTGGGNYIFTGTVTAPTFIGNLTGTAANLANFSVAHGVNPDTKGTTGIHYFAGGATSPYGDGALYQQAYQAAPTTWGSQIMQDYRTGRLAVRGLSSAAWTGWLNVIDSGNIGSQSVNSALYVTGNNASYPVTAGDGNGLKFWNGSNSYKISMGVGGLYQYGPVTDYSIKTQMDAGSPGRGFTWGREGVAPIAALNSTSGNMQIAGTMTAGSFSGPMSGTLNSANVSAGAFGSNTGGGNYSFPGSLTVGGLVNAGNYLQINSKYAIDGTDSYLRLNQQNSFTSGIYTPYNFRADGIIYSNSSFRVGGGTSNATIMDTNQVYCNNAGNCHFNYSGTGPTYVGNAAGTTIAGILNVPGEMRAGTIRANSNLCIGADCKTAWSQVAGTNYWTASGNNISSSNSGNVGIGTADFTGGYKLKVLGTAYISSDFTVDGKFNVAGAGDVAEEFGTTEELPFGTVVVMAEEGIKTAKPCEKKYDKKVIGVVSDNPSIVIGKIPDKIKAVIALTGVVKVKVTTQNGNIEKGDLLVTSDLLGHAMKATEEKVGTIIGKALENFSGQTGEITALINLQ